MADRLARVSTAVERGAESHVRRLQDLVRVAREGETATQAHVASAFAEVGAVVETFHYAPRDLHVSHQFVREVDGPAERTCVVARAGGGADRARLLLFAHPDVEPMAGAERWLRSPFAGTADDGRVYGWGVADDLAGVATMIGALDAVRSAGLVPRDAVLAASTPSKRAGQGIVAVLDRGHRADAAVYLHPAESGNGLAEIKTVTPGLLRFRVTLSGQPADTHEPEQTPFAHRAVNPIEGAGVVAAALGALAERRAGRVHHPALDAAVGRATNLQLAYLHAGDPDHLGRVPAACVMAGSVTFPPGERMEDVQSELVAAVQAAAAADVRLRHQPPRVEWLFGARGAELALDQPLCRAVTGAILAVTGRAPRVNALHASSDIASPILHAGIPTLGFGPRAGDLSQAGGHDEWVDLEEYLQTIAVTARLIVEWCGAR